VDRQIVEDDHVAFAQGRRQLRLDRDVKRRAGDRAIDNPGRAQLWTARPGDEGVRLPMAEGSACAESLALATAPRRRVILVLT
jgi:hypothetical protein